MSFNSGFFVRLIFHWLVKPVLALFPSRLRNQVMTIAHHIKMVFFQNQIMQFGEVEVVTRGSDVVPAWVVNELRDLAEIEPSLLPTSEFLSQFHAYRLLMNDEPGRVFAVCRRIIGNTNPDVIFIAPYLKRGGADLGTLYHLQACEGRGLSVVLITTLDTESPWLERVPKDIPVVELGILGKSLNEADQLLVLVRLVLQTNANTIHIIQSQLGWKMLEKHGKSLRVMGKSVFASLYCDDRDSAKRKMGYSQYLPATLPYLSGIICDTEYFPKELMGRYGVDSNQIYTVYLPASQVDKFEYISSDKGSILWGSRISHQKRPDILLKIALAMPGFHFHVKGHAETEDEMAMAKQLRRLPNVTLTGAYSSLVEEGADYSLFLYTSEWDGLPTILLEATVAGLPIIASSVGGVPEFINGETGYLVEKLESVDDYVAAIRRAIGSPDERHNRWKNAVELVQKRHSFDAFSKQVEKIDGYFSTQTSTFS